MLSVWALWDFQQGILCLQMRERSPPAVFHRPDGINAANVLAVTLLFRLVRKSKPYLWPSFYASLLAGQQSAHSAQMKAVNLQILPFKSPALSLCGNFKAPLPKIFKCGLTIEQQFGATRGVLSPASSVALAIKETPCAAERGAGDTEQGNN